MAETREEKHLKRLKALNTAGRFAPNTLDQQGMCHIHHAVYRGYLMCAKWLFKHGSNLTTRSAEGSVPAHYAAAGGHLECLRWIYRKASKSITLKDNSGATPLYFSAQEGHLNCLVWLTKHSGTVHNDMSVDGMTAAHAAALEGHLDCLAFLLSSAGCSALAQDRAANTPLHYAAACGRRSCVEWLMTNVNNVGNKRNKLGSTPLHVAAQNGHLEVVKLLVRAGVGVKLRDRLGRTPFDVAMESGNEACAQFLYQAQTYSIEGVNGITSGSHSLKRVRFERKAIEKDSEPAAYEQQSNHFAPYDRLKEREHRSRKPHSLYKNSTESGVFLNHHNHLRVENERDRSPYKGSSMDGKYTVRLPQELDSAFEDLQLKSHSTSSSLLPWSRVYRMTQSTESLPNPSKPEVYGSYSLSDTNGRDNVPSERYFTGSRNYRVTNFENPSGPSEKQNTSFLSRFVPRRKNKDFFPAEVDNFDDIVNDSSQDGNVFKRLYRYSKRKVTRSSSFAIESLSNEVLLTRKNSFVVSGNDAFLSDSTCKQANDPVLHRGKEDKMSQEKGPREFSSTEVRYVWSDSFINERTSTADKKKTRKRLSNVAKDASTSRENSLIW